jgi:hypothetical protein
MPTAAAAAAAASACRSSSRASPRCCRDGAIDVAALLEKGESDRVEFKETARWNVRDDKKDARMEQVVAKTVAAFLNSSGGTSSSASTTTGRARARPRLRDPPHPDADRFELWLRDMLATSLGKNAAAMPRIRFAEIDGATVCAVRCPRAPEPVAQAAAPSVGAGRQLDPGVRRRRSRHLRRAALPAHPRRSSLGRRRTTTR